MDSIDKIERSFIELVGEKRSFALVSIVEICTRAEIHRTTFYLHYSDKHELLEKCLLSILDVPESEVLRYTDLDLHEKIFSLMKIVAENCNRNSDFLLTILADGRYPAFYESFNRKLQKLIGSQISTINKALSRQGRQLNEYCDVFLSSGLLGSILHWAQNGKPTEIDRYCTSITDYVIATLQVDTAHPLTGS